MKKEGRHKNSLYLSFWTCTTFWVVHIICFLSFSSGQQLILYQFMFFHTYTHKHTQKSFFFFPPPLSFCVYIQFYFIFFSYRRLHWKILYYTLYCYYCNTLSLLDFQFFFFFLPQLFLNGRCLCFGLIKKKKLLSYSFPPNTRVYVVPVYVCGFLFLLFLNQILFYTLSVFIPFPKTFSYHLSTRSVTSQWLFPFCVCVYTQNVVLRAAERLIVCWRCVPCVYFGHNVTWVFVFSIIMIIIIYYIQ